jgi:perosamine synthetase
MKMFEKKIKLTFKNLKNRYYPTSVAVWPTGKLITITRDLAQEPEVYEKLTRWRSENNFAFPTQVPITTEGIRKWLIEHLLDKSDRILFLIVNDRGNYVGHIGLNTFNWEEESCEIDNVVRGESESPGIMSEALKSLVEWAKYIGIKTIYLRVFNDNFHAMDFYFKNGFDKHSFIPLEKEVIGDTVIWKPSILKIERFFMKMIYKGK